MDLCLQILLILESSLKFLDFSMVLKQVLSPIVIIEFLFLVTCCFDLLNTLRFKLIFEFFEISEPKLSFFLIADDIFVSILDPKFLLTPRESNKILFCEGLSFR